MPSSYDSVIRQLSVGTKVQVREEDDDSPFEGIVHKVDSNTKNYVLSLSHCHKVGSTKLLNGIQQFHSDTIEMVSVVEEPTISTKSENANFVYPSGRYMRSAIVKGTKVQVKCMKNDEIFEGTVFDLYFFHNDDAFCLVLSHCKKAGTTKTLPDTQEFLSDDIKGILVVSQSDVADSNTNHLYPMAKNRKQNFANDDNPMQDCEHLSRLFPLSMEELLAQKQIVPPPTMQVLDELPLKPRKLPVPAQELSHMTGKAFVDKEITQYKVIRDFTWINRTTPPHLLFCPTHLTYIDKEAVSDAAFSNVREELFAQSIVGFSMQGTQGLCRIGEASVVAITTKKNLYLFDVVALGEDWCFSETKGFLRALIEDPKIMKVVHDCRALSDILKNKYKVLLCNIYDTLAAHVVFSTWAIHSGYMPRFAMPLSDLVRGYLGITPEFIAFQHVRSYAKKKDTAKWMERPLTPEHELIAIYESMYLLDLQRATREAMNKPFLKVTEIFMNDISAADELDSAMKVGNLQQLPLNLVHVLPNWKPDGSKACRFGLLEDGFVHQTTCQLDPMLNFSRDVMHAKKPPGDYSQDSQKI